MKGFRNVFFSGLVAAWIAPGFGSVGWAENAVSPTAVSPVHLAIVSAETKLASTVDLLTVELSGRAGVVLLERSQIDKVLSELSLSAAGGGDYVKLGEILGADGLIILEIFKQGGKQFLSVRLVAVREGIVLREHIYPWPVTEAMAWSARVANQFMSSFPALTVLPKDAVPLSILNLRSSTSSAQARAEEREVAQLLTDRLSREPEVFVMERQHLREAAAEKEMAPSAKPSSFWTGRYLLDGTLDKDGFDSDKITISARLLSPQGTTLTNIELAGARQDLPAVVQLLAVNILAGLRKTPTTNDWRPAVEGNTYYNEAVWANKWGVMSEAQTACESAWALGTRSREVALLLLRSYMSELPRLIWWLPYDEGDWDLEYDISFRQPDPRHLNPARRALEFYCAEMPAMLTNVSAPDQELLSLGLDLLTRASRVLEEYYYAAEARQGNEAQLSEIRSHSRELAAILRSKDPKDLIHTDQYAPTRKVQWACGGYWFEKPEEGLRAQWELLQGGWYSTYPPSAIGWTWQDRKRVPGLLKAFVQDAVHSSNPSIHLEGLLLAVAVAPQDENGVFERTENELLSGLWEQRQIMFAVQLPAEQLNIGTSENSFAMIDASSWFWAAGKVLRIKREGSADSYEPLKDQDFANFKIRLRSDFFNNPARYDQTAFRQLFAPYSALYSDAEIAALLPQAATFVRAPTTPNDRRSEMASLTNVLEMRVRGLPAQQPAVAAEPVPFWRKDSDTNKSVARIRFRPLKLPEHEPEFEPVVQSAIARHHRIWFQVRFQRTDRGPFHNMDWHERPVFVGIAVGTEVQDMVLFPAERGYPDPSFSDPRHNLCGFEVTEDSLYVTVQNRLERYHFKEARWETIAVPMDQGATIAELNGRLYLNTEYSILEFDPGSKAVRVLASSRRRPAVTPLDELFHYDALYPGPGNLISVVEGGIQGSTAQLKPDTYFMLNRIGDNVYTCNPANGVWKKTSLAPRDVDTYSFKSKVPVRRILYHLHWEMDGQPADPFARAGSEAGFNVRRETMVLVCDSPSGVAVANPLLAGYWFVSQKKLDETSAGLP